jgi:hypothetical protein
MEVFTSVFLAGARDDLSRFREYDPARQDDKGEDVWTQNHNSTQTASITTTSEIKNWRSLAAGNLLDYNVLDKGGCKARDERCLYWPSNRHSPRCNSAEDPISPVLA